MLHYRADITGIWNIYNWGLLTVTDLFMLWDKYGSNKIYSRSSKLPRTQILLWI